MAKSPTTSGCPKCGSPICPECNYPITKKGRFYFWLKDFMKVVWIPIVIPFAVVWVGHRWNQSVTERVLIEEKGRRQQARLDEIARQKQARLDEITRQKDIAIESMAAQMEKILPLGQKSIEMRNALTDGCATGRAAQDRDACLAHYLGVLKGLDEFVAEISWQMDTFPVASKTYKAFDKVKQRYWDSCDDDEPEKECGWRQIIVRHIYGIATEGDVALADCRGDKRLEQHNRACHAAIAHIREVVAEAIGLRVNCFMCELVEEVKTKRLNNLKRLAKQERAAMKDTRDSAQQSASGISILEQLVKDLAPSEESHCDKLRKSCQKPNGGS